MLGLLLFSLESAAGEHALSFFFSAGLKRNHPFWGPGSVVVFFCFAPCALPKGVANVETHPTCKSGPEAHKRRERGTVDSVSRASEASQFRASLTPLACEAAESSLANCMHAGGGEYLKDIGPGSLGFAVGDPSLLVWKPLGAIPLVPFTQFTRTRKPPPKDNG